MAGETNRIVQRACSLEILRMMIDTSLPSGVVARLTYVRIKWPSRSEGQIYLPMVRACV